MPHTSSGVSLVLRLSSPRYYQHAAKFAISAVIIHGVGSGCFLNEIHDNITTIFRTARSLFFTNPALRLRQGSSHTAFGKRDGRQKRGSSPTKGSTAVETWDRRRATCGEEDVGPACPALWWAVESLALRWSCDAIDCQRHTFTSAREKSFSRTRSMRYEGHWGEQQLTASQVWQSSSQMVWRSCLNFRKNTTLRKTWASEPLKRTCTFLITWSPFFEYRKLCLSDFYAFPNFPFSEKITFNSIASFDKVRLWVQPKTLR